MTFEEQMAAFEESMRQVFSSDLEYHIFLLDIYGNHGYHRVSSSILGYI